MSCPECGCPLLVVSGAPVGCPRCGKGAGDKPAPIPAPAWYALVEP